MTSPAVTALLDDYHAAMYQQRRAADLDARRAAHAEVIRLSCEIAQHGVFVFNGDYHDLAQIIPFIEDYWTICDELKAAGKRPYNDSFAGRIPGLAGALPCEETPIYLLGGLRHLVEGHDVLAEFLEEGYVRLTELLVQERFASVVVFDQFYRPQRYEQARVIPDPQHKPSNLLPKGRRTRGRHLYSLDQVYVRRS
jgi:hypothetical protein